MEKHKNSYKNNKSKISAPTWKNEFELPDRSYSISDIQNYFFDNTSMRIYVNKIENRVTFEIKTGYYLQLSTLETMKLLGNT